MWGYSEYVPVAERRARAKRKMEKLRKKGMLIEPVEIEGRTIARKFWGKKWCDHLETFSDYSNRLPRGRTYVRNGSVCHLGIKEGCVDAHVSGSSLYNVKVKISPLEEKKWKVIKERSSGQIGSLLELLKGSLSDQVMRVVADHKEGLFPNEGEIQYSCDCPDWADMCKHVAAVLYGIGSRLDDQPDLLFLLRGVDAGELITTKLTTTTTETDDLLIDEGLSDIFGIDLDDEPAEKAPKQKKQIKPALKNTSNKTVGITNLTEFEEITGKQLQEFRIKMNLTVGEFAATLEVTPASIYRWEKNEKSLKLHGRSAKAIAVLLKQQNIVY